VGKVEAELLFVVSVERKGVRLATEEFKLRLGPLFRMRAGVRVVLHPLGGTRKPELVTGLATCRELQAGVNALLRPLGAISRPGSPDASLSYSRGGVPPRE